MTRFRLTSLSLSAAVLTTGILMATGAVAGSGTKAAQPAEASKAMGSAAKTQMGASMPKTDEEWAAYCNEHMMEAEEAGSGAKKMSDEMHAERDAKCREMMGEDKAGSESKSE